MVIDPVPGRVILELARNWLAENPRYIFIALAFLLFLAVLVCL